MNTQGSIRESPSRPTLTPFASFKHRDFRFFWVALFVSDTGGWMQLAVTSWLLYSLTASGRVLMTNALFRLVPIICLGLFGGAFVDHYERKRVWLITQLGLTLAAFVLAVLNYTGAIRVWHIHAITILGAVITTLEAPSRQALLAAVVPRTLLPNAIAFTPRIWKGSLGLGTVGLGSTMGATLIATLGTTGAFFANSITFLAAAATLLFIRASSPGGAMRESLLRDALQGIRYVSQQPAILCVMVMVAAASVFVLDGTILAAFAVDVVQARPTAVGFLEAAYGVGALVGLTLLITIMGRPTIQGKISVLATTLYGASLALFALSSYLSLSLVIMTLVGATDIVWGTTRYAALQLESPESMRGRMMAIFYLTRKILEELSHARMAVLVPVLGAQEGVFLGGMTVVALGLLILWRIPGSWRPEERR